MKATLNTFCPFEPKLETKEIEIDFRFLEEEDEREIVKRKLLEIQTFLFKKGYIKKESLDFIKDVLESSR